MFRQTTLDGPNKVYVCMCCPRTNARDAVQPAVLSCSSGSPSLTLPYPALGSIVFSFQKIFEGVVFVGHSQLTACGFGFPSGGRHWNNRQIFPRAQAGKPTRAENAMNRIPAGIRTAVVGASAGRSLCVFPYWPVSPQYGGSTAVVEVASARCAPKYTRVVYDHMHGSCSRLMDRTIRFSRPSTNDCYPCPAPPLPSLLAYLA